MIARSALLEALLPHPSLNTRTHAVHPHRSGPPKVFISTPLSCTSSHSEARQVRSSVTVNEEQKSRRGLRLWAELFPNLHQTLPRQLPPKPRLNRFPHPLHAHGLHLRRNPSNSSGLNSGKNCFLPRLIVRVGS